MSESNAALSAAIEREQALMVKMQEVGAIGQKKQATISHMCVWQVESKHADALTQVRAELQTKLDVRLLFFWSISCYSYLLAVAHRHQSSTVWLCAHRLTRFAMCVNRVGASPVPERLILLCVGNGITAPTSRGTGSVCACSGLCIRPCNSYIKQTNF